MPFAGADSTPQRQISRAELEAHRSAASCWVAFKGRVYDVTSFLPDHPGGPDFILDAAREDGGDVADKMLDPLLHAHSDSAFEMLEAMCIGVLAGAAPEGRKATKGKASDSASKGKSFDEPEDGLRTTHKALGVARSDFVDPYRPMLAQVFSGRYNKKVYLEQVHIPRHVPGSAPIFGNFLEPLTKTPWWAVPLIWIPFGQAHTLYAWYMGVPLASLAFYWACGLLVWSFIEYSLHRWLFHIDTFLPDNRYAVTLHFLAHGIHHFLPMDKQRLVMPPALFTILMLPIYKLFLVIFADNLPVGYAIGGGTLFGYVLYDCMHYYLHHGKVVTEHARTMKGWHLDHHYKQAEKGFGITSKLWDWVFGTEFTV